MAEVLQLMGQYGFSMVFCLILTWYVKYITDKHRADTKELHILHKEEVDKFAEALNNNTIVIHKLLTKLGETDED